MCAAHRNPEGEYVGKEGQQKSREEEILLLIIVENIIHFTLLNSSISLVALQLISKLSPPRQRQDDVRGDAHHQRGHGAEPARLSEQRLGPGLALRAADGQHAGRAGPAAGHAEGDAGEPRPGPAASSRRHLRPRLSAATAQLRPATGEPRR